MKKAGVSITGVITIILFPFATFAQPDVSGPQPDGVAIAISAGHYQYDAAMGIEVSSPSVARGHLRLRSKMNRTWLEHYKSVVDQWAIYHSYWLGLVYSTRTLDRASMFIEFGSYHISPDKIFSNSSLHTGYYTTMGVEFFVVSNERTHFCYFISGGFAHIRAYADKMEGSPRYGNGITFTNGLRYYFK